MNKKPSWLLRSLSVFFSAALLTGNISAGSQIVFAESADVTFDSSVDEEVSSDIEVNEEDIDNTEETVSETDTTELLPLLRQFPKTLTMKLFLPGQKIPSVPAILPILEATGWIISLVVP